MTRPWAVTLLFLATSMMWLTCSSNAMFMTTERGDAGEFVPTLRLGRRQLQQSQQPDSPGSTECPSESRSLNQLQAFLPCLTAVSPNPFFRSSPDSDCCSAVRAQSLPCLCSTFLEYRSRIPSGQLDIERLVQVPRQCGMDIPAGYDCGGTVV